MSFIKQSRLSRVEQIIQALEECSGAQFAEIYQRLNLQSAELSGYESWSAFRYTRNCIQRTNDYELLLLCWEQGQATPIHNHNDQECWVYNLQGMFKEEFYDLRSGRPVYAGEQTILAGESSNTPDSELFHRLINAGPGRAMSLHLYVKPIDKCLTYDENRECLVKVELNYDTLNGELTDAP